jgi:hypothetical protein
MYRTAGTRRPKEWLVGWGPSWTSVQHRTDAKIDMHVVKHMWVGRRR